MMKQTIEHKIKQRRLQLLIHSCIYYELNDSIISDATWSKWARELVELQKKYPEESSHTTLFLEFKDFDGSTGMNLPITKPEVISKAKYLLNIRDSNEVVKKPSGLLF